MKAAHDSGLAKENIYGKKDISGTNPQSWFDGWTGFRVRSGAGPLAQRPIQGIFKAVATTPAHARAPTSSAGDATPIHIAEHAGQPSYPFMST